jgi:hypothetical protein
MGGMDKADFTSVINHDRTPVEFKTWGPPRRIGIADAMATQRALRDLYGADLLFISPPCAGHSRPAKDRRA